MTPDLSYEMGGSSTKSAKIIDGMGNIYLHIYFTS